MREMRNAYKILFRRAEGKTPLGWLMYKREDNIKMDLKDTAWKGTMDSSEAQLELVVNIKMNLWVM
jgi:hypothetical protein